ncbi:hypothetical protein GYMLUDRAFT_338617 [Collybiopsis luxurians FD-317 M1]|nr:hypothetical protein GYMLUDRAFT_338617 [Collybiopsis luxurians FD-317 M1]
MASDSRAIIFPSEGLQVLSCLIYILGVSILSHCLSRRVAAQDWSSWSSIREMTWARICALLVFLDSWLFLSSSGIIVFGIGLEKNDVVCSAGIFLCVVFYATSKFLIYCFLVERVYLVWSASIAGSRLRSPIYLGCMAMVGLYGAIIASMFAGHIAFLRQSDGLCIIGLKRYSSLMLLCYDLFINIVLTLLFLWPVLRANLTNPRLRLVAVRTLLAAGVALTTSTVNMLVLTLLHGQEQGWVCLGSCGADVIFNALAIFWITRNSGQTVAAGSFSGHTNINNNLNSDFGSEVYAGRRVTRVPPGIKIPNTNMNSIPSGRVLLSSPPPTPSRVPSAYFESPSPGRTTPTTASAMLQFSRSPPNSPAIGKFASLFSPRKEEFGSEEVEMQPPIKKPSLIKTVAELFRSEQRHHTDTIDVRVTVTQDIEIVADDITGDTETTLKYTVPSDDESHHHRAGDRTSSI